MTLDGKRQRNALTAAENAIKAIGAGNGDRARKAAAKAAELDQIGAYAGFTAAIEQAAADLASGVVSDETWATIAEEVGPGPLAALIDQVRRAS